MSGSGKSSLAFDTIYAIYAGGPERRFAAILENDDAVEKWFKPAKSQFQIFYRRARQEFPYEPDFAVETKPGKPLCEPKRASEMNDEIVLAKARGGRRSGVNAPRITPGRSG